MEVWISSPVVLLVRFADKVRAISSTGLNMVVGELDVPAKLREELRSFDSIVSWYGTNNPDFRRAMRDMGLQIEFLSALPPNCYAGHAADFFADQVGAPRGLTCRIPFTPETRRESVTIHPFSGSARKNWPLDRYRELARRLPISAEWTAGPEETLENAVRFSDLERLGAWLAGSQLYIGNDSGITHLAAATGIPTIALFGYTKPEIWAPRGENVTVSCANPISALEVETVLQTLNRLLDLRASL